MHTVTKIKSVRKQRGWSQAKVAVEAGMSVADLSRIETGRMIPYPSQAKKLSFVLGMPADDLQKLVQFENAE